MGYSQYQLAIFWFLPSTVSTVCWWRGSWHFTKAKPYESLVERFGARYVPCIFCPSMRSLTQKKQNHQNYFTSSDPHHDMLGGGCQVRVVIENMMGRMENLRTLISGFLGLVILVRWALVTMFLSWTTQTGCRIHRTYVSLIGSGEGRHTTHLLKCVLLLSTSQTAWKQSSDVLSDISFDILSDISFHILSDISSDILSDIFLTYLLTFFLTNRLTLFLTYLLTIFWHIFRHSFWHIFWHSFWHIKTKS